MSDGNTCDDFSNFYRSDDVDIKEIKDGVAVGHCQKGEWMNYTVNVAEDGEYKLTLRVGTGNSDGGKLTISVGNTSKEVSVDKTGSWGTFAEVDAGTMKLSKGEQVCRSTLTTTSLQLSLIQRLQKLRLSVLATRLRLSLFL